MPPRKRTKKNEPSTQTTTPTPRNRLSRLGTLPRSRKSVNKPTSQTSDQEAPNGKPVSDSSHKHNPVGGWNIVEHYTPDLDLQYDDRTGTWRPNNQWDFRWFLHGESEQFANDKLFIETHGKRAYNKLVKEREAKRKASEDAYIPRSGDWRYRDTPLIRSIQQSLFASDDELRDQMATFTGQPGITVAQSRQVLADTFRNYESREKQPERFDNATGQFIPWLEWLEKYDPVTLEAIRKLEDTYPPIDDMEDLQPPEIVTTPVVSDEEEENLFPGDDEIGEETQYDDESDLPDWFREETQNDETQQQPDLPPEDEEQYPVTQFMELWESMRQGFHEEDLFEELERFADILDFRPSISLRDDFKRFFKSPEFTATDGGIKRRLLEEEQDYIRFSELQLIPDHLVVKWKEVTPTTENTEDYRLMARRWVWLADLCGIDYVLRDFELPISAVQPAYPVEIALGVINDSYRIKMKDIQRRLMEALLNTKIELEFYIDLFTALEKVSKENPGMRNAKGTVYSANRDIANLNRVKISVTWDVPNGYFLPDQTLSYADFISKIRDGFRRVDNAQENIKKLLDKVFFTNFRYVKGGNTVIRHNFGLKNTSAKDYVKIDNTYLVQKSNDKRTLRLTSELHDAPYSIPILEEGVDPEANPPAKTYNGTVSVSHFLEVEVPLNYFDMYAVEILGDVYYLLRQGFHDMVRFFRDADNNKLLEDMRAWLLANHRNEVFDILSMGELPDSIDPRNYNGDWEKRPLSYDELALLSSENHFLKENEVWLAGPFIPPDEDRLQDETTWDPMLRHTRQRVWEDPPVTVKVYPDDPMIPPEYFLRVVLRGSTTQKEVDQAQQIPWVLEGTDTTKFIDSSELGQQLGKRWNLWIDQGDGIKNHVLAWMNDNKDKLFRTNTSQWIVTVNSNMTNGFMRTQNKSPQQFQNWVEYFLRAPSEEFIRGRRSGGDQSSITLKNILRWNLTKTVIENSPSKGLVHFHGLLEVTYAYCESPLVVQPPPPLILDYKAFINYMQLYTAGAYVNFTSVKNYMDEEKEQDFQDRWEKYIKKGMEQAAKAGTSFVGIANTAVRKKKRGRIVYEYNKKK